MGLLVAFYVLYGCACVLCSPVLTSVYTVVTFYNLCPLQEVRELKDLPKLIIVDMSGNPLVSAEDYRLYTVYFLRRLKVPQ